MGFHEFNCPVAGGYIYAGGFVAVPLIWAAKILRKKIIIHQQDLRPGLANKLCAPAADLITTVFPESLKHFPKTKTKSIGNPVRSEMVNCSRQRGYDFFKLDPELPTLLILGGGTGAKFINDLVSQCLPELLTFCQIIHSVGRGKKTEEVEHPQYHSFEFLTTEMPEAMAAADLVVSRAGLGTLTELSVLGKPTILVPIADSHQEDNANYYKERQAAVVFFQQYLTPEIFVQKIKELIRNQQELELLGRNIRRMMPSNAASTLADLAFKLIEAK
jgi:UDP-N-acetylglucosamine--N-acetylmuramyl-(pentapeptide) pyrophosphoryl-undecaprenol N-acetylglucosamine transferase